MSHLTRKVRMLSSRKRSKTEKKPQVPLYTNSKMAGAASSKLSLKLLVDKKAKKVLFAEAGKDTIDFLCSILTLPMATIIRLLSEEGMVGCLSNLYQSIESLKDDYVQPNMHKDTILKPMVQVSVESASSFFLTDNDVPKKRFYTCNCSNNYDSDSDSESDSDRDCSRGRDRNHNYVAFNPETTCPSCNKEMRVEMTSVERKNVAGTVVTGAGSDGGFVKGVVTYMVMDDLLVAPMSSITGITQLIKFNVMDVRDLEQRIVNLDMDKALKLLKTYLHSKNVLSNVFL